MDGTTTEPVVLRLYVAGHGARAAEAKQAVDDLVTALGTERVSVTTVDVLTDPATAEADSVLATPMVVRMAPEPVVRVVGTIPSAARLARALQFTLPRGAT